MRRLTYIITAFSLFTKAPQSSLGLKITFYVSTVVVTLIMAFSVSNYFFNHEFIRGAFMNMGYPTYIIYPLATVKIFGVIVLWYRKSPLLTGLAYAGFFYNFLLAFFAHIMVSDNAQWIAVAALVAVYTVLFFFKETVRLVSPANKDRSFSQADIRQ